MMGHNIRLMELYGKVSVNYPCYPFLSGALSEAEILKTVASESVFIHLNI